MSATLAWGVWGVSPLSAGRPEGRLSARDEWERYSSTRSSRIATARSRTSRGPACDTGMAT